MKSRMSPLSETLLMVMIPLLCTATVTHAQVSRPRTSPTRAAAKTASVEGDIYLVMKSGDTKPGAGRTVYLLEDAPGWRATHARLCTNVRGRLMVAEHRDKIEWDRRASLIAQGRPTPDDLPEEALRVTMAMRDSVRALIAGAVRAEAPSGMAAHYRFDALTPGKYILFAEWVIGDNAYEWWAPIELSPGQKLRRDLDNSVLANGAVYCRPT